MERSTSPAGLEPDDPQDIGPYRLLGRLGAGGTGRVYLARAARGPHDGRAHSPAASPLVAVKLIRPELAEQEEFRTRLRRETAAAQRLAGPWLAPVLDADPDAAAPWVATAHVAGPSLSAAVAAHGPLPEPALRLLAAGLARALREVHGAGLVHRDLKPSHVLLTPHGPRVIATGTARALETVTDGGLTRTGTLVGAPVFLAPEQVRGEPVTTATDVFGLGSVLAYAAAGAPPFGPEESGAQAVMFRITQAEPDLAEIPAALRETVRACLAKEPAARPTVDALLAETAAADLLTGDGRARAPWLPERLSVQLLAYAQELTRHTDASGTSDAPDTSVAPGGSIAPGNTRADARDDTSAPPRPGTGTPPPPSTATHTSAPARLPHTQPATDGPEGARGYGHPFDTDDWHELTATFGLGGHTTTGTGDLTPPEATAPATPGTRGADHTPAYSTDYDTPPYDPAQLDPPPRRNRRLTALLLAVTAVVLIGAGGSVYAVMTGDGASPRTPESDRPSPTITGPASPGPLDEEPAATLRTTAR